MQRPWLRRLQEWMDTPGFRQQTIDAAAAHLKLMLPAYPLPSNAPVAICAIGLRWFMTPMEAIADAVYRSKISPHAPEDSIAGADWHLIQNPEGLWSVPGRCALPRGRAELVGEQRGREAVVPSADCWPVRRYLGL